MATVRHSARGARRRVVLKARDRGTRRERGSVSDGAEMYDLIDARSSHPELCIDSTLCDDWGSVPVNVINKSKSDTHILDINKREDTKEEVYPIHSTPLNTTIEDNGQHHSQALLTSAVVPSPTETRSLSHESVSSEEGRRDGDREAEEGKERRRYNEGEGREETGGKVDREVNVFDTHSDDVFVNNNTLKQTTPHKPHHNEFRVANSCSEDSTLKNLGAVNDLLPPLPTSRRRRRPYTSPGRNSSSCSTDSYTSPVRNNAESAIIPDGRGQMTSSRRKHQRSAKSSIRGRTNNRVHPENRPPNLQLSSPLHSVKSGRTLSSTDSVSSTLSTTLMTPLLTASLRKGGGGSMSLSDSAWDFDAKAQLESLFPDKHMQVLVVTWNMQQQKDLPGSLDDLLLPLSQDTAADMFVLGTQESTPSRREWEVLIQQTLGPSYVLVQSYSLGVIYLLLYLRRDLIWFCSAVCTASFATRPGTLIKTKGAVGLSFTLFGSSFLFITSHFTAHDQKVTERNSDMQRIAVNLSLAGDSSEKEVLMLDSFDHIFWFGDFNYRVELTRDEADQSLANSDWMSLLLKDQLTREILHGNVFQGFSEQPISFTPSYKFDLHSDIYDSSEKRRVPSWTDRILFKSKERSGINGCEYGCCHSLKCSDHRPVYGIFKVKLVPSKHIEGIPDTVVTFDREIYIQAQRQRKIAAHLASIRASEEIDGPTPSPANRTSGRVTSSVCTII